MFDRLRLRFAGEEKRGTHVKKVLAAHVLSNNLPELDFANPAHWREQMEIWLRRLEVYCTQFKENLPHLGILVTNQQAIIVANVFDNCLTQVNAHVSQWDFLENLSDHLKKRLQEEVLVDLYRMTKQGLPKDMDEAHRKLLESCEYIKKTDAVERLEQIREKLAGMKVEIEDCKVRSETVDYRFTDILSRILYELLDVPRLVEGLKYTITAVFLALIKLFQLFLERYVQAYLQSALSEVEGTGDIPLEIIQEYERFVKKQTTKLQEAIAGTSRELPSTCQPDTHQLNRELEQLEKGIKSSDGVKKALTNMIGVEWIWQGYEADDQQKIIAGAEKINWSASNARFCPIQFSLGFFLIHGISQLPQSEKGAWDEHAYRRVFVTPEEYVQRVLAIRSDGLRASQREDSPFTWRKLAELQEIWFYNALTIDGAIEMIKVDHYGPVNLVFRPEGKFAVFEAREGRSNRQEYCILAKRSLRAAFQIFLCMSSYKDQASTFAIGRDDSRVRMTQLQYASEVKRLLDINKVQYTVI